MNQNDTYEWTKVPEDLNLFKSEAPHNNNTATGSMPNIAVINSYILLFYHYAIDGATRHREFTGILRKIRSSYINIIWISELEIFLRFQIWNPFDSKLKIKVTKSFTTIPLLRKKNLVMANGN